MAELKDRLRELRKANKFTQKDIANFLGITESGYGYYEQGRNNPPLDSLKKLANKYNVRLEYLTGESDDPSSPLVVTTVVGKDISISPEELLILEEIRKHPIMFHELTKNPEKNVKDLIKMWKFIKQDMIKEDDEEYFDEDIIED